jgi:hypothetical protein
MVDIRFNLNKKNVERIKQKLLRLVTLEDKAILDIRRKWNIPKVGFITGKDSSTKFYDWHFDQLKEMGIDRVTYRDFLLSSEDIGRTLRDTKTDVMKGTELIGSELFNEKLIADIREIIKRNQLSDTTLPGLLSFILFSDVDNRLLFDTTTSFILEKSPSSHRVKLLVDEHTDPKDIVKHWPMIKQYILGRLKTDLIIEPNKNRKSKSRNFERDLLIYKLHKEGKNIGEINKALENKYSWLPYYKIYRIIERFEKNMNI